MMKIITKFIKLRIRDLLMNLINLMENFHFLFLPSSAPVQAPTGSIPSLSVWQAGRPTLRNSTFQAYYNFDIKSKVVNLNDETLKPPSNLNPISHGGSLTLFSPQGRLDDYFTGNV